MPCPNSSRGMKIEHFTPRAVDPRKMYDWDNLLGVCGGLHVWQGEMISSCDASRPEGSLLFVHPAHDPPPETVITPDRQGRLSAANANAESDLERLNLRNDLLNFNRAEVVEHLRLRLKRDDSVSNIRKLLKTANSPPLPPYSFVAVWYLNLKLRARLARDSRKSAS